MSLRTRNDADSLYEATEIRLALGRAFEGSYEEPSVLTVEQVEATAARSGLNAEAVRDRLRHARRMRTWKELRRARRGNL